MEQSHFVAGILSGRPNRERGIMGPVHGPTACRWFSAVSWTAARRDLAKRTDPGAQLGRATAQTTVAPTDRCRLVRLCDRWQSRRDAGTARRRRDGCLL